MTEKGPDRGSELAMVKRGMTEKEPDESGFLQQAVTPGEDPGSMSNG
jgi:hypothetical protein